MGLDNLDNEDVLFQFDEDPPSHGHQQTHHDSHPPFELPMMSPFCHHLDLDGLIFGIVPYPGSSTLAECGQFNAMEYRPHHPDDHLDDGVVRPSAGEGPGKDTAQPNYVPVQDAHAECPVDRLYPSFFDSIAMIETTGQTASTSSTPISPSSFAVSSFDSNASSIAYQNGWLATDSVIPLVTPQHDSGRLHRDFAASPTSSKKGKERVRADPPFLPSLSFSSVGDTRGGTHWPMNSTPSPASSSRPTFRSSDSGASPSLFPKPSELQAPRSSALDGLFLCGPSRRRSTSNISVRRKCSSLDTVLKTKESPATETSPSNVAKSILVREEVSSANDTAFYCSPSSWSGELIHHPGHSEYREFSIQMNGAPGKEWTTTSRVEDCMGFLNAHRFSHPPTDPLDVIPAPHAASSEPIRLTYHSYFDERLPREIKLYILLWLVRVHEEEYARVVQDGVWSVSQAGRSKNWWVGRDLGLRDLVRFSRVSRDWQSLVVDGQLWSSLSLEAFPRFPSSSLVTLGRAVGGFAKALNIEQHTTLMPATLKALTRALAPCATVGGGVTHLTEIKARGCTSLDTSSMHQLLMCSPALRKVNLRGLRCVTNATCDLLASKCSHLISLDVGRCRNLNADGILSFTKAANSRKTYLPLKSLKVSGLQSINDSMMAALGKAAPLLEVLDLSGATQLHNSALDAFVSCIDGEPSEFETVLLTSRDAGRDPDDATRYRRRVTRLRHLSLSSCPLLTDGACANLIHTMPNLEFLELAGIGSELKDDGLVRLLQTTPLIRRVDVEEASGITDAVIRALTPISLENHDRASRAPQPGHALEYLAISYSTSVSNAALQKLIQECPRLTSLVVDNTRVSSAVVKTFVSLARERQAIDAQLVAVDCRGVGEAVVKDLVSAVRPRLGWRSWHARKLEYLDARDGEQLSVGQDECDERRVVLKTFYSWQTVDAVRTERERRRRESVDRSWRPSSRREVSGSVNHSDKGRRHRWWSASRRGSGMSSPSSEGGSFDRRDGCTIM